MYYYIVNPAAGHGQIKGLQDKLKQRLDTLGISGQWSKTTGPGEATRLTEAAVQAGATTIVAIGGDDTLNEVINGIGTSDHIAVGVIPLGLRNRLSRQLGIITWQQACDALAARRLTSYSLIAAGQQYFLSTLTLGFETDLDKRIDAPDSKLTGRLKQFTSSFGHARRFPRLHAVIEIDDSYTIECDVFSLAIANQKFLNPLADNQLLVAFSEKPRRRLKTGKLVWQSLRRQELTLLDDTASNRLFAKRVVLTTTPATGIMVDGKVAGRTPIAIRLTDRNIRFITEKIVGDFKRTVSTSAAQQPKNQSS
ncbi:hypothetical protein IPG36_03070 [bacterium]|nr:MAG: hypothetical protein IPG36_03070 [bacterium]